MTTDYSPLILPGLTWTSTAGADITAGDPLEVAGPGLVRKTTTGPSGLGSAAYVGVAAQTIPAGRPVTVVSACPVHEGTADGAITAADQVMTSAKPGRQVSKAPLTGTPPGAADVDTARVIIGVALTTSTDGGTVRWLQTR